MLRPKIDSTLFPVKQLLSVSSLNSHFTLFFSTLLLRVLFYHTFKFSHGTFLPLLNSQKQECSCFRWKLPHFVTPSSSHGTSFFSVKHAVLVLSLTRWCVYPHAKSFVSWVCRNVSVHIWQCVSQSKWRDLQQLDREEQKESAEHSALLSATLHTHNSPRTYAFTVYYAYTHTPPTIRGHAYTFKCHIRNVSTYCH